jgi:hypothetical protein
MMQTIGLMGGHALCELGTVEDVQQFFDCIDKCVMRRTGDTRWNVVTDRLYRRYLRPEELPIAAELMKEIKDRFADISPREAGILSRSSDESRLDPAATSLAEMFEKFFIHFEHCKESAEIFFQKWKKPQPLRIVRSSTAQFMVDSGRKLDAFDALTGEPFWKQ